MRIVCVIALVLLSLPAVAQDKAGVAGLFQEYGLLGEWAVDCKADASPSNPHVEVSADEGNVVERHDLGSGYRTNEYRMLSARRVSPMQVSVEALFEPGSEGEQKQDLTFSVHDGTRRTVFTRVEGGSVRVKDGLIVGHGVKTPRLRKCG